MDTDKAENLTQFIETADGQRVGYRSFEAAQPRAVMIIASAMGVSQDFYAAFARWLASQGVAAYTFDYRGTGASLPETGTLRGYRATIEDWARYDCAAMIELVDRRHPELPLFWIGHSVGAQILGLIPNYQRISGMLSVAAGSGYFWYNARPLRYYVLALWFVIAPLALRVFGYFPGRKLGVVGDLPYGVMTQWRRWCLSEEYLGAEGERVRQALARVELPITALSMQDDEMMTFRGTRALFSLYRGAQVELKRVKPSEHGVEAIGHFGFFRPKMEGALWPLVPEWMQRNLRPNTL
jgi:predicted alpha/beta hydrolase